MMNLMDVDLAPMGNPACGGVYVDPPPAAHAESCCNKINKEHLYKLQENEMKNEKEERSRIKIDTRTY